MKNFGTGGCLESVLLLLEKAATRETAVNPCPMATAKYFVNLLARSVVVFAASSVVPDKGNTHDTASDDRSI
jgi:hypothetical protein